MKKILTNKKGFTLIELLAVIVVLAIIMVIATQQVNGTIKKSRANTYADTVMSIKKGLQTVCATDAQITSNGITSVLDFSDVTLSGEDKSTTITVKPSTDSKYNNMDAPTLESALKNKKSITLAKDGTTVTITTDCEINGKVELPESK